MRDIIAITQVTLDGVMQAPGGPEEDPSNRFTLVGTGSTLQGVLFNNYRPADLVKTGTFGENKTCGCAGSN